MTPYAFQKTMAENTATRRKCIKHITNTPTNDIESDDTETFAKERNVEMRRKRNAPTSHSECHVSKIGDIYRRKTSLSTAYPNSALGYNGELQILANKRKRVQNVLQKHANNHPINNDETLERDDYK